MKLFHYKANDKPINYFKTNEQIIIPDTYQEKPFRAFWVSNVVNIDLPTTKDVKAYKDAVIKMLDTALEYNLTAIFFQVRTTNDAFYASKLNPYSRFLTGKEGLEPPFDVMNFVINETKKRDLEFHAWCNPYRVSMGHKGSVESYYETCDDLNFAKQNQDLTLVDTNGQIILNPTKEAVKQFIVDSMIEITEQYDIDGIHFDDYFYPYAGLNEKHNDQADYEARTDQSQTLGDFRRMHVTDVIKRVHQAIKQVNPNVRFGVSPFGIWMNKINDSRGSNTDKACSQSYDNQYADTYTWVKNAYVDYVVPQIYWEFGHKIAPHADILKWWVDLCKDSKVELYIGHAAYRLGQEGEFENPQEVVNQLKFANQHETVKGNVFFTYKNFIETNEVYDGMQAIKRCLTKGDLSE